ncbi:hypothetical protein HMPREF1544_03613 [Mucor circinelloides 1006PhL]|uniref:Uncharacterized protein n=1 Tax=Mucor circinelloides f. circinelloides (strain 1006PhL) TaxID=1220926 RepID=S2JI11_MUCC1|nr:hypothetical protein HMPREF1544_03613 [Mucor circinelloides 1006PhL]KAG1116925.1 hypothetical protein G6F42_013568 [Rhizopus arrhizus]
MDSFLLDDNILYLAENCVRSFTTPAFIPAIVFSAISGLLAVAFYEKFVRKEYFLPYFYFGNTALLYTVAHIFLIIFISEDNIVEESVEEDSEHVDLTHEFALYASLIIASMGSFFINLGSFRLLEIWVRRGQHKNTHLASYYLTVIAIILSTIPVVFSVAGDVVLIHESSQEREMADQVRVALILKLIGALCNIILVLLYISLCICYAWSAYISNACEKAIGTRLSQSTLVPLKSTIVDQTFKRVVVLLLVLGLLILLRFIYDFYIVVAIINLGPIWDVYTYLVLVVADGIILLIVAYSSSLTLVTEPVVFAKMRQKSFRNYYYSKGEVVADELTLSLKPALTEHQREVIPLSRSPIILEEEYPTHR